MHLLDNIRMPQVLQQADFADSRRRDAIVFLFESDLLDSNQLVGFLVQGLIHDTVGTFTEFFEALVFIQ